MSREHLQPTPDLGTDELRFIQAIISLDSRLITYLRMDDVFPAQVARRRKSNLTGGTRRKGLTVRSAPFVHGLSSRAEPKAQPRTRRKRMRSRVGPDRRAARLSGMTAGGEHLFPRHRSSRSPRGRRLWKSRAASASSTAVGGPPRLSRARGRHGGCRRRSSRQSCGRPGTRRAALFEVVSCQWASWPVIQGRCRSACRRGAFTSSSAR